MSTPNLNLAVGGDAIAAPPSVVIALCVICGENPRAGCGRLTRCVPCIRIEAEKDRQDRLAAEALVAARAKAEQPKKKCQACKVEKSVTEFGRHRLARDGYRRHCRKCVASSKPQNQTPGQRARALERRRQPHRKAANLESALSWQARNADAVAAHKAVDRAVRAGDLLPAKTCQVASCKKRTGLAAHHNSYAKNRRTKVLWLCRPHHQNVHAGRNMALKKSAPVRFAKAPATA